MFASPLPAYAGSALCKGHSPAGLAEGSRWSFRAKGERPPENRVGWSSTPAGCQNLGDMTAATTRPAVLTASTWGRIGLRAFPEAPGVPVRTSAGDDAPPARRYTPHYLQAVISGAPDRKVPAQFSGTTPISSRLDSDGSGTPAGVPDFSCAVVRRSPPLGTLGDLRLPSGNPSG